MSTTEGATEAPADSVAAPSTDWTEAKVFALVAARHPTDRGEWATFGGLRTLTGYGRPGREAYLDGFALNCWPSSGFTRVAYEIKVARGDWLRELRDPGKRRPGLALSNEFWFVAPHGVIQKGEVPEACGFLEADAGGLKTRKAAPHRDVEPLPLEFVASVLRAAGEQQGKIDLRTLRAFRYAGRDLTAAELLEAAGLEHERWVQAKIDSEVRRRVAEEVAKTQEASLARAVRAAMGKKWSRGGGWGFPTVDEFRRWLAAKMGEPDALRPDMAGAVKRLAYSARSLVEDIERLQGGGDA